MGRYETLALPSSLAVQSIRRESESVVSVLLADPSGAPLPEWDPGAHLELKFSNGLIRHYSLCGPLDDSAAWRIAVLLDRSGRGGSRYVHEELSPGHEVQLRNVRNFFTLEPASHYLFVAGGIGITPILPMVRQAAKAGIPYTLSYIGRTVETMAFLDELPSKGDSRIVATAVSGRQDVAEVVAECPPGAAVYCCGPATLIRDVQEAAAHRSLPVHFERFSPSDVPEAAAETEATETSFEVVLAQSGGTYQVPAGESILEVLESNNIPVDFTCREGTCGTCETTVLAGDPDHRDSVLDEDEKKCGETMMICVSRSLSTSLTLDL